MRKKQRLLTGIAVWMLLLSLLTCHQQARAFPWEKGMRIPVPVEKPLPLECVTCTMSDAGLTHLKLFEGFSPFTYLDAVGLPTICWGHLIKKGEKFNEPMMGDACTVVLRKDVKISDNAVNRNTGYRRKQHQHDALSSFFFNLGEGKVVAGKNTITAIRRAHHDRIPGLLKQWVYGGAVKLRGLIIRRDSEALMYQGMY